MVDSTIARGGETPWLGGACVYMWQLGRTTKSHCAERWGAKEERVHYLSRQLLPLVRVTMSLSHDTIPEILVTLAKLGIKVIWATLTF